MSIQESADKLAAELGRLKTKRVDLSQRIADLMNSLSRELQPLRQVMAQFRIPYQNPLVEGESHKGFVLDETVINGKRALYVFMSDLGVVQQVCAETDEFITAIEIEPVDFAETCDLDKIKAAFDYVRNLSESAIAFYRERNNAMAKFIDENK